MSRDKPGAAAVTGRDAPPARASRYGWVGMLATLVYPFVILAAWRWLDARYIGCILFALLWLQRLTGRGVIAGSLRELTVLEWVAAGVLSCTTAAIALT